MNTLTATFEKHLPEQTGQGKNGEWRKMDFIVKTNDNYPKQICFTAWGGEIDKVTALYPGDVVTVEFELESREYKERYYTQAKALKIEKVAHAQQQHAKEPAEPIGNNNDLLF